MINTAPFWVAILSYFLLKTRLKIKDGVLMIGCFTGVVLLALSKYSTNEEQDSDDPKVVTNFEYMIGIILLTVLAIGYSIVSVISRMLKDVHFSVILFWYAVVAISLLFSWIITDHFQQITGTQGFGKEEVEDW